VFRMVKDGKCRIFRVERNIAFSLNVYIWQPDLEHLKSLMNRTSVSCEYLLSRRSER
jgi:hypothetical protein